MGIVKTVLGGSEKLTPKQEKFREIFMYLLCGGLTTVVNLLSFWLFDHFVNTTLDVKFLWWSFDLLDLVNQTIAWVLAVLVAFTTNRLFVFHSNGSVIKELSKFVASRIATFLIFELGTFTLSGIIIENALDTPLEKVAFTVIGFAVTYKFINKIANAIIVVIVNYFLSKMLIFKRKETITEEGAVNG
ncbi:MAG: GtrA family protein [Clostridia bacterium]|nr:GtrA family protein [Clostridia bacterium]